MLGHAHLLGASPNLYVCRNASVPGIGKRRNYNILEYSRTLTSSLFPRTFLAISRIISLLSLAGLAANFNTLVVWSDSSSGPLLCPSLIRHNSIGNATGLPGLPEIPGLPTNTTVRDYIRSICLKSLNTREIISTRLGNI